MREIWKPFIRGWYEVSNFGRVRSVDRVSKDGRRWKGRILILMMARYCQVKISVNGRQMCRKVHKLVARTFLGKCPQGKEVNHKDGNKHNPRLDNLEYVTHKKNREHAVANGLNPTKKNGRWRRVWHP